MEDISIAQTVFKGWESFRLRRGPLDLILVPQVGGRIMGLSWRGTDVAFTQPELEGKVEDLSRIPDIRRRKKEMGFPYWGGDKTWLSPQNRWTESAPFLDLDSGPYHLQVLETDPKVAVVRMTSGVCRETGVRITRTVTLTAEKPGWMVAHRLSNASNTEVVWGLWSVSNLLKPGFVYLPTTPASRFPQGLKIFPEEGESTTARGTAVSMSGRFARIDCRSPRKFKFGVDSEEGWILGIVETADSRLVGYRKAVQTYRGQSYAHGCTAEVFCSNLYPYFEMEIHGPVVRLRPGESFELEERQELFDAAVWPTNETELRRYVASTPEHSKM